MSHANLKLLGLVALWMGGGVMLMTIGGWLLPAVPVLMITVALLS